VRLLIGSDQFRKTPVGELFILARLEFSNRDILRIALADTARAIFPERKLGMLADGYEASFLVLDGNPIDDLVNIRKISLRVKQGLVVP
jgi:imidazolonepropionase-like amidohydrolase